MGLNQTMHFTSQHLDHRRRMKANAEYAQYLVSGSTTSDLVARLVAAVYAVIAAAVAATIVHAAGYTLLSSAVAVSASAIAVVSALWPPDATTLAVRPGGPPPRWTKRAKKWLARARKRLPERMDAAATKIAARYRGTKARAQVKKKRAGGDEIEITVDAPPAAVSQSISCVTSLVARATSLANAVSTSLSEAAERAQHSLSKKGSQLLTALMSHKNGALMLAVGVQALMAGSAVYDFGLCIVQPPERIVAFVLLLVVSIIPLVDTVNVTVSSMYSKLCGESSRDASKEEDGTSVVASIITGISDCTIKPIIQMIEGSVHELVNAQLHTKLLEMASQEPKESNPCTRIPSALYKCFVVSFIGAPLHPRLKEYGVMVRGSPAKSFVAIVSMVIALERYASLMLPHHRADEHLPPAMPPMLPPMSPPPLEPPLMPPELASGEVVDGLNQTVGRLLGVAGAAARAAAGGDTSRTAGSAEDDAGLLEGSTEALASDLWATLWAAFIEILSVAIEGMAVVGDVAVEGISVVATQAATSGAVVSQIKPNEYAATQASENKRANAMQAKRDEEKAKLESMTEEPLQRKPFPWKPLALVVALLSVASFVCWHEIHEEMIPSPPPPPLLPPSPLPPPSLPPPPPSPPPPSPSPPPPPPLPPPPWPSPPPSPPPAPPLPPSPPPGFYPPPYVYPAIGLITAWLFLLGCLELWARRDEIAKFTRRVWYRLTYKPFDPTPTYLASARKRGRHTRIHTAKVGLQVRAGIIEEEDLSDGEH